MLMPPLVERVPVIVKPPEPLVVRPAQLSVSLPVTVSVPAVTPVLLFVTPPAPVWMPPPVETVSVAPATRRAPTFAPDDPSMRPADTMLPLPAVLSVPVWSVIEAAWSVPVPTPSATVLPAPGLTVTAPYALPATPDQWEVPAKAANVSEPAPDDE